jgi:hypothetical protein
MQRSTGFFHRRLTVRLLTHRGGDEAGGLLKYTVKEYYPNGYTVELKSSKKGPLSVKE